MANLQTHYLGMTLKNPLIAGASPFSTVIKLAKQLEEEGVAALVMNSLFEEEVIHESLELDYYLNRGTESQPEAQTYLPEPIVIKSAADRYLERLRKLKAALQIPVLASLNGTTNGGWIDLAKEMEAAGADALELNMYSVVANSAVTPEQVESEKVQLVHDVSKSINIPVAVKLSPFFTALPNLMRRMEDAGARGFILFNRFMQPDIDIERLTVESKARLSTSADIALPARWIALLSSITKSDLALSSGIHSSTEMVKGIMSGAMVTQCVSEFLLHGVQAAHKMLADLDSWMDAHGYESVEEMRGTMAVERVDNPIAFERANYIAALRSYNENVL